MEAATLPNRVKDCIVLTLLGSETRPLADSMRLEKDLGMDSLDRVDLAQKIEDEFGVATDDADAQQWATVGDVTRYVKAHAK